MSEQTRRTNPTVGRSGCPHAVVWIQLLESASVVFISIISDAEIAADKCCFDIT